MVVCGSGSAKGIGGRAPGAVDTVSGIGVGATSEDGGTKGKGVATGIATISGVGEGVGVGIGIPWCRFCLKGRTGMAFLIGTGSALRIGMGVGFGVGEENAETAGAGRGISGIGC